MIVDVQADVVLRGYSGYNIAWASHLLDPLFPLGREAPPAMVTLFFGANDAAIKDGCKCGAF